MLIPFRSILHTKRNPAKKHIFISSCEKIIWISRAGISHGSFHFIVNFNNCIIAEKLKSTWTLSQFFFSFYGSNDHFLLSSLLASSMYWSFYVYQWICKLENQKNSNTSMYLVIILRLGKRNTNNHYLYFWLHLIVLCLSVNM